MCQVPKVLLVCENCVVICMMFVVCTPAVLCFLWMPNVHFKFEKQKGEYALSSIGQELGENTTLVKLYVAPSSEKYSSDLTNMLVRSEKDCMTPPVEAPTLTLLAILEVKKYY